MSREFLAIQADGASAFVTAFNAALATLTDPSILRIDFDVQEQQRRSGREYSCLVTYDTGGASLATPFLLSAIEAASGPDLVTALNAFVAANVGAFAAGSQYRRLYPSYHPDLFIALTVYNATGGASANWTPT